MEETSLQMQEGSSPDRSWRPTLDQPSTTWSSHDTPSDNSGPEIFNRPVENPPYATSVNGEKVKYQQPGESSGSAQRRDDGTEYPQGMKLAVIVLALCLAIFLMALEYFARRRSATSMLIFVHCSNSIITTAIPKITDEFNSLADVGWYGSAYLLTTAALQLLFGKFYTFCSIKWVFLTAIGIFELGSLVCGVAPNSTALILGRALAGLGSAGLFSGGLLILANSVPLEKRPTYIGLIGGMYGIAAVAGPLLGGAFTDRLTWRWCFYINLPIGAVTATVISFFYFDPKRDESNDETVLERFKHFDPIGTSLFMPAIISLLLALQWGGTEYSWNDGRIVGLFVTFGVLIVAFLYVQYRQQENATVPPRIIFHRSVWAGCLYGFCSTSTFFLMVYYIPIWFQAIQGTTAVESGIRNLPMLISTILLSIMAGGLVTKLGFYTPFMIAATVLMSIGAGLVSTFKPDTPSPKWIGYQILFGTGYGMGSRQPLVAVQTVLDLKDAPTGISVLLFLSTLGGAVFVSVGQSIFTNQLGKSLARLVPSVDPRIVLTAGATDLQRILPPSVMPGVITAYNTALTKTFLVSASMAAITVFGSILMPWNSVKQKTEEKTSSEDAGSA